MISRYRGPVIALAAGRRVQCRHVPGVHGERLELVDVVASELVVEELGAGRGQRVLSDHAGEQQRRRVGSGEEDGVGRQQRVDGPDNLGLKRRHGEAGIAAAHQVGLASRGRARCPHSPILPRAGPPDTPTFVGWCGGAGRIMVCA